MEITFTKMQGLGNDFIVIDATRHPLELSPNLVRRLADRRFGIGCDQLLVVEPATRPDAEFRYRIFNADGSEVEQCGNGARCFARFVHEKGLTSSRRIPVETSTGRLELVLRDDGQVTVDMGVPVLEPEDIPFDAPQRETRYPIAVAGAELEIAVVSLGNPHAVLTVPDIDTAPVAQLGPAIEAHPRFPNRVNVGFLEIVDRSHIRLRVFERGAGETLACGSGACAAVVAAYLSEQVDETVDVRLPGGNLVVSWAGENHPVLMTGPASFVYEGRIIL
ncbi:MAG: diaminopimelate epimerase [Thiogranum sp.]|nr:diaminopimelate epimerase [Thiogranum sp.]